MDEYSGKRPIDGVAVSRKGSGLVLRDGRDQNTQFCNRVGCSGRLNSMKSTQMGCSEKAKPLRSSFRSASSGKEIVGSSSRSFSSVIKPRKPLTESRRKVLSRVETDSSESSSVQDEPQVSELVPSSRRTYPESRDVESSKKGMLEVGSSRVIPNAKSRSMNKKSGPLTREISKSSASLAARSAVQATQANASRYGLRNLRCNSISDVVPSGCSKPGSNLSRRKDVAQKKNCEGQSSSSVRGKKSTSEGHISNSNQGISISDSRTRSGPPTRDGIAGSVRTRKLVNGHTRTRLSNQETGNSASGSESFSVSPHSPQPESPIDLAAPNSSHQFSRETRPSPCSRPGSSSGSIHSIMPTSPSGVGITRSSVNRDGFLHCNMEGIAEVLLALERIEQDEELTYEQLLVLESNLFISGLNLYDQHREMRLDIDNMSYEELLALEDRMGCVSTALTEEAMSKCLKTSIYDGGDENEIMDKDDDIKCSICQEEYARGDEVGRLECDHNYHVGCIHHWLRLKNWCPICKTAACSSSSPMPSS